EIGPNYPNPFNSYTAFLTPGNLSDKDDAYIEIFDILGAKIKSITISSSSNRVVWDGANQNGIPVASGVYFYRLCKGDRRYSSVHKMILLR
ncbi:MAG: T9SS type A sorting domain-containing protein, partial [candidate division Zixibacteria bacterium]|nr:T9SS type A sorting domain-containing protein [candidate division Zixibacteria bacterium]